jgi:hypothetical protein
VPHDPPITITASALATMTALRASPMPVAIVTDRSGDAPSRLAVGRTPTTMPPAARAPAATAPMTPAPPPQITTTSRAASSRPTSCACAASDPVQSPGPHTAT